MKWPFVLRSTHERDLVAARTEATLIAKSQKLTAHDKNQISDDRAKILSGDAVKAAHNLQRMTKENLIELKRIGGSLIGELRPHRNTSGAVHQLLDELELRGCDSRIRFGEGEDELPVIDIPYTEDELRASRDS